MLFFHHGPIQPASSNSLSLSQWRATTKNPSSFLSCKALARDKMHLPAGKGKNSGFPEGLCSSSSPSLSCSWTTKTSYSCSRRVRWSSGTKTPGHFHQQDQSALSHQHLPMDRHSTTSKASLCALWGSSIQQWLPALPLKLLVKLP